jgi:hypothetical protein
MLSFFSNLGKPMVLSKFFVFVKSAKQIIVIAPIEDNGPMVVSE